MPATQAEAHAGFGRLACQAYLGLSHLKQEPPRMKQAGNNSAFRDLVTIAGACPQAA